MTVTLETGIGILEIVFVGVVINLVSAKQTVRRSVVTGEMTVTLFTLLLTIGFGTKFVTAILDIDCVLSKSRRLGATFVNTFFTLGVAVVLIS